MIKKLRFKAIPIGIKRDFNARQVVSYMKSPCVDTHERNPTTTTSERVGVRFVKEIEWGDAWK